MTEDTDPTTARMGEETGHACMCCPTNVRNPMATTHNLLGALESARSNYGEWARVWRKAEGARKALALLKPTVDAHFAALDDWRRP